MKFYITLILIVILLSSLGYLYWDKIFPQPVKHYTIGVIVYQQVQLPNIEGLKKGLADLGYKEGYNVNYIIKNPQSDDNLAKQYADELIQNKPDIIVVASTPIAQYLRGKKSSIPMVFMDIGSLKGVVDNVAVPEGNITGLSGGIVDFAGKRLEILKEIDPTIKKVIVSPDPKFPNYNEFMKIAKDAAIKIGVQIVEIPSHSADDFVKRAQEIINKKNGDAFLYFPGPNNVPIKKGDAKLIVDQFISAKIPAINHNMEAGAVTGILASYGNYRFDVGKEAAMLVDKVLLGTPISQIPVLSPLQGLSLEINLKTAKAMGINIPKSILNRASKVYP